MIKNKDFMLLLTGRFITNFGDSIYTIAAMSFVFALTGSSFYTGLALFLTSSAAIIQILLSPMLDRINMKRFLILSQVIQGLLLLTIPLLHMRGDLKVYHLLILMPIISLINQLVYPGQLALLPKILSSKDLVKANSLFSVAYRGSDALFNALSGFIIATAGLSAAYYINSITFFANGALFLFLSEIVAHRNAEGRAAFTLKTHFRELRDGLRLWSLPILKALLIGVVLINFAATGIFAALPEFSSGGAFYGILMSASGLGVLLGAMLANSNPVKKMRLGSLYILCIFITGAGWISMGLSDTAALQGKIAAFCTFLSGWISVGILNIYSQTILQKIVPAEKIGAALSSMIGISVALAPLGALSAGFLSRYFQARILIVSASVLILAVGIRWLLDRNIRGMDSLEAVGKDDPIFFSSQKSC